MTARKARKIMGMIPFEVEVKGGLKGFGAQFVDLLLEILNFAFEHNSRPQRAGERKPLPLHGQEAFQGIEQDGLHA
jgi:hypothetical protein